MASSTPQKSPRSVWDAHQQLVQDLLRDLLPEPVNPRNPYANKRAYDRILFEIHQRLTASDSSEIETSNQIKTLVSAVLAGEIGKFLQHDQLTDEQLAKQFLEGDKVAGDVLVSRYVPQIPRMVRRSVTAKHICPRSEDLDAFLEDIAQNVCLKLLSKLGTYRLEQNFNAWLHSICENEAYTEQRKLLGRSKHGKRKYVSLEELQLQPAAPVIRNEDHRAILRKILDKHRAQGSRAEKSADAIELRYFENMDGANIAKHLHTTLAYVYQLFSDDYPKLRKIALEDFGLSGTDL